MGDKILKTFALASFGDRGRRVFDSILDRKAFFPFFERFSEGVVEGILRLVKYSNPVRIFSRTVVLGRGRNQALIWGWGVQNLNETFSPFVLPFRSNLIGFLIFRIFGDVEVKKLLKNVHSFRLMFFVHDWIPSTNLAGFFVWLAVHIYSKK